MDTSLKFEVTEEDSGKRLDTLICEHLKKTPTEHFVPSRSKVARWIEQGLVTIDTRVTTKASSKSKTGHQVSVTIPSAKELDVEGDDSVRFEVIFEDEHVLVINKPAGLVVHPAAGNETGTLVNGLISYLGDDIKQIGDALRPGIVHRLDKDTSGLMVVAKTDFAHQNLTNQFQPPRTIKRNYLAITKQTPQKGETSGVINAPIDRHQQDRKRMAVAEGGREAVTHWELAEEFTNAVALSLELETGRTHQIRVHLQHAGCPIIGDNTYGPALGSFPSKLQPAVKKIHRQALHAQKLSFIHPANSTAVHFEAQTPNDILDLIDSLR